MLQCNASSSLLPNPMARPDGLGRLSYVAKKVVTEGRLFAFHF